MKKIIFKLLILGFLNTKIYQTVKFWEDTVVTKTTRYQRHKFCKWNFIQMRLSKKWDLLVATGKRNIWKSLIVFELFQQKSEYTKVSYLYLKNLEQRKSPKICISQVNLWFLNVQVKIWNLTADLTDHLRLLFVKIWSICDFK